MRQGEDSSILSAMDRIKQKSTWVLAAVTLLLGGWLLQGNASAAAITVNTTADELNGDGDCSLREAIRAANLDQAVDGCSAGDGADTIFLPPGEYLFDAAMAGFNEDHALTGDLDIREDLTIEGAGRVNTWIDANGLDRVFHVIDAAVEISSVTIRGVDPDGNAAPYGGGIYVFNGALALSNSRLTDNEAAYNGGGVYFSSEGETLTVVNSRIDGNTSDNTGGGLDVRFGALTLIGSRVEHNMAGSGAGIQSWGPTYISNSVINNNTAVSLTDGGGGLSILIEALTMVNSTISGNSAAGSGAGMTVGASGTANLYNVTITNNTADTDGDNTGNGGGIRIAASSATVNFQNTIIAGNSDLSSVISSTTTHPDCSGTFNSLGYNLVQDTAGCVINGNTIGNQIGVDAKLGPLANNGGPTMTHALQAGSPAIDAGDPSGCLDENGASLIVDQRGYVRPVNGDATSDVACDIGAFERLSPGPPTATATATSLPTSTATATPTSSATPTATATSTVGPSPTATATSSPTSTATATPTSSVTPTATATSTVGPSPTADATSWPTAVSTATAIPTAAHELYLPIVQR